MQVDPTSNKACPKCQTLCNVMVGQCHRCGHLFRTQFVAAPPPNVNQTQVFGAQQLPPNQQPQVVHVHLSGSNYSGQTIQMHPGQHQIVWPILLSLFCVTGTGQMANKQVAKGVVILILSIVLAVCTYGLSMLGVWPACIIDAILIGNKLRDGRPVGQWEFF